MTPALPAGCVIALLGAESTGKTELAHALTQRLNERGIAAALVGEYLREWCDREGRTPRADEQRAIADEQIRRIDAAAASGTVVVADTTAVMTAVYSELLFADRALYAGALAAQRRYAITLLTALDLPWVADPLRDGPHVREPVDALVRGALARSGIPYAVVHGSGAERLAGAWRAIQSVACRDEIQNDGRRGAPASNRPADPASAGNWSWACDKCSDPECEHRLFTDLVARRG